MLYHPKPYNGEHGHIKPRPKLPCQCADHGCPVHRGTDCPAMLTMAEGQRLFRVDMDDFGGTRFCGPCAEDAMESGLYSD